MKSVVLAIGLALPIAAAFDGASANSLIVSTVGFDRDAAGVLNDCRLKPCRSLQHAVEMAPQGQPQGQVSGITVLDCGTYLPVTVLYFVVR